MLLREYIHLVVENTIEAEYPVAGSVVDGRVVRSEVPNTASIAATLYDYVTLPSIREVPMSQFDADPRDMFYAANDMRRARQLASEIQESGEIAPLIVVIDEEGPYVLEGAHRLAALHILGAQSFPALVVLEEPDDTA